MQLMRAAEKPRNDTREINKNNAVPWDIGAFTALGWVSAGHLTLKRELNYGDAVVLPGIMPDAAGIVMPGIGPTTRYADLLFFDLETTGLSGGAGTIAFLAAFGRLIPMDNSAIVSSPIKPENSQCRFRLIITQYLLLDYPGEYDFVEAMVAEFKLKNNEFKPGIKSAFTMISYNGKSFDSQILKTRCLMNGISQPEYLHADLLHPSRRLWKSLLPDCSQGTIETVIFGIDRTGDIPGAMAPDIWFSFLKTGDISPLMGICEHNLMDISGLARIFSAMAGIAADPFSAMNNIKFDIEALALCWFMRTRKQNRFYDQSPDQMQDGETERRLRETGHKLMRSAAEMEWPRAEFQYALFLLRSGNYLEGRELLLKAVSETKPFAIRTAALRALAIDSERRVKNTAEALAFAEHGLELLPPDSSLRDEFERRIQRLQGKIPFK
jgi:uncharacterized protein YprB with RNaseH-like and TPR domain